MNPPEKITELPKEKTQPKGAEFSTVALHGGPKIGKSTFCSKLPKSLFLAPEPGLGQLETHQIPIDSWEQFEEVHALLKQGDHDFQNIIIDTVPAAYRLCTDYICKKFGINHESDLGFGKGYALINNEFQRFLYRYAFLPQGLFLISHSETKEIETQKGKINRVVPNLPAKARKIMLGLVDFIFYCDFEQSKDENGETTYKRVFRTKPNMYYEAGDRTGKLPPTIDLDYDAFSKAFEAATAANAKQETIKQEKTHVRK